MINSYDLNNEIQFLAKSEIRLKIIGELEKNPKTVKELVKKSKNCQRTGKYNKHYL